MDPMLQAQSTQCRRERNEVSNLHTEYAKSAGPVFAKYSLGL